MNELLHVIPINGRSHFILSFTLPSMVTYFSSPHLGPPLEITPMSCNLCFSSIMDGKAVCMSGLKAGPKNIIVDRYTIVCAIWMQLWYSFNNSPKWEEPGQIIHFTSTVATASSSPWWGTIQRNSRLIIVSRWYHCGIL